MSSAAMETTHALYPWFIEHGARRVHPADLQRFTELIPSGKVFGVQAGAGEWVELRYGVESFRVDPALLQRVAAPAFAIGQSVSFHRNEGPQTGVVRGIFWHYEENRPFYILTVGGKKKSRRFWEAELTASAEGSVSG